MGEGGGGEGALLDSHNLRLKLLRAHSLAKKLKRSVPLVKF